MLRLIAILERALGRQWMDISEWLRSLPENDLATLERRIAAGELGQVVAGVEDAALRWAAETQGAYVRAGQTAARWLDNQPAVSGKLIRFDLADANVVERARRNQLEHVVGFRQEANAIAQQVTQRAIAERTPQGLNPRRVAQDFRDSIGLAPIQETWVANYRRALEEGRYADAMGRELRDARADAKLERLKREGKSLSQAEIDSLVERYRKNALVYRSETIARTEGGRNTHAGLRDSIQQAVTRGDIDADLLVKEWIHGPRTKLARPDHQAMGGRKVKWDEPFTLPDGTHMMQPHDDNGGAKHNANCRCTVATTVDIDALPTKPAPPAASLA